MKKVIHSVFARALFSNLLFAVLLLSAPFQADGQGLNARYIKSNTKEFPRNTLTSLLVYDNYGVAVKGLDKGNFTAFLDGKEGKINSVSTLAATGKGIYTVLCIDVSGSMKGKPIEDSKAAVLRFINELGDKDYLAIYSYGEDANLVADFSNDKGYLSDQVKKLAARDPHTSLFYGANKGLEKLRDKAKADEPVNLIIIGDGNNDSPNGAYSIDDVISKAKEIGVPVFTFGYTSADRISLQNLEKIGNETGGRYYDSPGKEQLDENFKKMRDNIMNIYILSYAVYDLEGKGQDANGVYTVKKDPLKSEVTGKVNLPPSKAAAKPEDSTEFPLLYVLIAAGALLLVGGIVLIVTSSNKKKRQEAERRRRQEEEAEAAKLALQREKEEFEKAKSPVETPARPVSTSGRTMVEEPFAPTVTEQGDAGRTVIVRPGQGSAGVSTLYMDVKVGELAGQQFTVTKSGAIIGRSQADATLVLPVSTVSKRHAKISWTNAGFVIEDLNSSNGVFVNMNRITGPVLIADGNSFKIGGCEGHFRLK